MPLSPDTTESDLKQRREIRGGGKELHWEDQAPVRAAIFGRILLIEGVEKAERNPDLTNMYDVLFLRSRVLRLFRAKDLLLCCSYSGHCGGGPCSSDRQTRCVSTTFNPG